MGDRLSIDYINSTDYKILEDKLKVLKSVLDDLTNTLDASRKLRYAEVDIEAEREAQKFDPDELYIPQHIIDTNIRREQSPYVQYITQSPRAVICNDVDEPAADLQTLDIDLTRKLRYDGWQLPQFANVDSFQQNGYGVVEVVMDQSTPGEVAHEQLSYSDFAFLTDTRDIQAVEMCARKYYYSRTKLLALCGDPASPQEGDWNRDQVEKILAKEPDSSSTPLESLGLRDRSLYVIHKTMYRINGVVNVAWSCVETCSDWLRAPRPLYLGRRKNQDLGMMGKVSLMMKQKVNPNTVPPSDAVYERDFPYVIFPYLISENQTISQLKGRVFLDQDLQEAVSSILSSTVTQARRAAGMYFSRDVNDPNDEILQQKNLFFRSGAIINSKINAFKLDAPDPASYTAIQTLLSMNQNETSQVNFAVNNRKDSRKTAEEVKTASQQQQLLSTVQVVLYSIALTQMYRLMVSIIKSRVQAGLIKVNPSVRPSYDRNFQVKPSGDIDVIQKQQVIQMMMQFWPTVQNSPIAVQFLSDLIEMCFPERAAKYIQILQQSQQQQQSQQAQQTQQVAALSNEMAAGIIKLSKQPEMFSETGRIHSYPEIKNAADKLQQLHEQHTGKPSPI